MLSPATDQAITQLIETVKQASPYLWSVAYRQVYVDAATYVAFGIVAFGFAIFLKLKDEDDDGIFTILACILGAICLSLLICGGYIMANPGYQAIKELTDLIPH